jgi:hypothetical protein
MTGTTGRDEGRHGGAVDGARMDGAADVDATDTVGAGLRELMERELCGVAPPVRGDRTAQVLRIAARLRTRRRVLAVTAVAAGTALAATVVIALRPSGEGGGAGGVQPVVSGPSFHAPYLPGRATSTIDLHAASALRALLPGGLRSVVRTSVNGDESDSGNLDGGYLLTSATGKVGGLSVMWGSRNMDAMTCAADAAPGNLSCAETDLPGVGRVLVQAFAPNESGDGQPSAFPGWTLGTRYTATLAAANGHTLFVADVAGFTGAGAPKPPMAAPPLTRGELLSLVQRPELRAGVDFDVR